MPLNAQQEAAFQAAMDEAKIGIGERATAIRANDPYGQSSANRRIEGGLLSASRAAPDADVREKLQLAGNGFARAPLPHQESVIRQIGGVILRYGTTYAIKGLIIGLPLVGIGAYAPHVMTAAGPGYLVDHHDGYVN